MHGNAYGSTLRLTLGCLLAERLGIELRRVGSGKRRTFGDGEAKLSAWMGENAFVCWLETKEPWLLEAQPIPSVCLPLNLDQNRSHAFHTILSGIRRAAKGRAEQFPILGVIGRTNSPVHFVWFVVVVGMKESDHHNATT